MTRRAIVQLLAYDEPHIRETLDGYAEATVPEGWRVSYMVGVTPKNGRTVREVEVHPDFELIETPPGKLTSRNHVHDVALDRGADVVISGDGDAPPASKTYLEALLEPFGDSDVVAVNGFQKAVGPLSALLQAAYYGDLTVNRPIYGRGSAFTELGWEFAGPFDTNLDELDVNEVRAEEEFRFRRRLGNLGEVVDRTDARVTATGRRAACIVLDSMRPYGRSDLEYCARRGSETFMPERRR